MTHTDLSAEEPSERAATGPQLLRWSWKAKAKGPGGASLETEAEIQAPPGGLIERAVAAFIGLAASAPPALAAVAILAQTDTPGWLKGAVSGIVFAGSATTAAIVIIRKGLPKR